MAVFDPATQSFRLEMLNGQSTLRHMPGSRREKRDSHAPRSQSQPQKVPRTTPPPENKIKILSLVGGLVRSSTSPPETRKNTRLHSQEIIKETKEASPATSNVWKLAKKPEPISESNQKPTLIATAARSRPSISPPAPVSGPSTLPPPPIQKNIHEARQLTPPAAGAISGSIRPVAMPSHSPVTSAQIPLQKHQATSAARAAVPSAVPPAPVPAAPQPPARLSAPAPLSQWKAPLKPDAKSGDVDEDMDEIEDDFFHGGLD